MNVGVGSSVPTSGSLQGIYARISSTESCSAVLCNKIRYIKNFIVTGIPSFSRTKVRSSMTGRGRGEMLISDTSWKN